MGKVVDKKWEKGFYYIICRLIILLSHSNTKHAPPLATNFNLLFRKLENYILDA